MIPLDFNNSCGWWLQLLARVLKIHCKKSGRKTLRLRKYFTPMFALAKMMFHIVVRCGNYARFAEIKLSTCVQLNPRLGLILFFYSWHQICCNCYFLHLSRNSAYKDPDSILLLELPEATCMLQRWLLKFALAYIVNNFLLLQQKRTAIVCKFLQNNANGDWYGSKTIS